jgi:transposase-like protein
MMDISEVFVVLEKINGIPMTDENSSRQWFEEAVKCHVEHHQGCPWCGRSHCVHHTSRGQQQIYFCQHCDFQVSHDQATGAYHHVVGETEHAVAKAVC